MKLRELSQQEAAASGYTHAAEVPFTDLVALGAVASGAVSIVTGLGLGWIVKAFDFRLLTPFDGGATSALAMDVGYNLAAGADDPDAFLDNYEVHVDATEITAGDGNGAVFATLRTGYAFRESASIEALFTATGGNLNALTAGNVLFLFNLVNLDRLRP